MAYHMENNNGIDGFPGLLFLGIGIILVKIDTSFMAIIPSTVSAWLGAFSFACSATYYIYKIYSEYKNNKKK